MSGQVRDLWQGCYKIPWHEEDFSRRMLREHLTQEHDLASRRAQWIEAQVGFINERILRGAESQVLDLGCGPGFYSHRLARLGHHCYGIDYGPASIAYAQANNPAPSLCKFMLGDIREAPWGGPYTLAMILYGEFNVFSPSEAKALLGKIAQCLDTPGQLILEVQTPEAIERVGRSATTEKHYEAGLFSDDPYSCRTENSWLPEEGVALQTFHVTLQASGARRVYRSTSKAWSDEDLTTLLHKAGFTNIGRCCDWPCNTDGLALWVASRR